MDRQFNNEAFEDFLKESVEYHRMYPSEKVWKGVNASLHTHRKWYAFTALGMLLLLGSFTTLLFFNPNVKPAIIVSKKLVTTEISAKKLTSLIVAKTEPLAIKTNYTTHESAVIFESETTPSNTVDVDIALTTDFTEEQIATNLLAAATTTMNENIAADLTTIEPTSTELLAAASAPQITAEPMVNPITASIAEFSIPKKQPRLRTHIYFIPTVSYRKLSENKNSSVAYQGFGYQQNTNVKNMVNHKPDLGFEFGIGGRYRVKDNFYLTTSLQFNITRYDIRAYYHPTEIATVALNSGFRTDSLASLSNYRNFNGFDTKWLENFYFQVALPIGAEFILAKNKKFNWGVSGSLQPTYVLGDRAYLISSDYKNYAKFPNLMRRWNLSTSVGTFVSYSTGKINWQVGPMLRYQQLSSFTSKYPVRENLFDIGFKIGATFNKR